MVKRIPLHELCQERIYTLPSQYQGQIEYVDISSVDNSIKEIVSSQLLDAKDAPSRAKQLIKYGDILVSTVRPNLNGVAFVDKKSSILLVASTGYCVLRCKNEADRRYVFYFCQSPYFVEAMSSQVSGANYPAVSSKVVKNSFIPVLPENEKKKMVSILDKVFDLISLRKQQLAKLDELVKSRYIEMFEASISERNNWAMVPLEGICKKTDDIKCGPFGTQLKRSEYQEQGVPLWGIPQINSAFSQPTTDFLTPEKADQLDAYSLLPGDIVMSRKGNVGTCAVYPSTFERGIMHSDALRIRIDQEKIDPVFLVHQLHISATVRQQIEIVSVGAIMAGINVTKLKKIIVCVPPLELQTHFSAFVGNIDKSKSEIQKSLDALETLKKALMQKYFG